MYPRFAFALLFSVSALGLGLAIPAVPAQCPENEVFKPCGSACVPTCKNPNPSSICTMQCVVGCFCKDGYLRNEDGVCVPANRCHETPEASMFFAYPPELSQCKENELFMPCGSACAPTCANPKGSEICTRQCVVGCFCKPGYLKNEHGICIPSEKCGVPASEAMPMMAPVCANDNEEYRQCKGCDGSCENPNPICPRICVSGCACKTGHVRDGNGRCMPLKQCPTQQQQQQQQPEPEAMIAIPPMCMDGNEEYRQCKGCDGSCENPNPMCPRICIPGCACKKNHVRGSNGRCMPLKQCPTQQQQPEPEAMIAIPPMCMDENEEYRRCKGCDGTCENPNPMCPKICRSGCACKTGHVRDGNGRCMPLKQCPTQQPASFIALPPEESKCPANEIFRSCGTACPATCADPHPSPICTRQCVIGCFCKEGFLRNSRGVCVAAANCVASEQHPIPMPLVQDTMQTEGKCASDREVYSECGNMGDCLATCHTPVPYLIHGAPVLPKKCRDMKCKPACVCKMPYVRNSQGQCVERSECDKPAQ